MSALYLLLAPAFILPIQALSPGLTPQTTFKIPPQLPPVFPATAASIRADARFLTEEIEALYDDIVDRVRPEDATFANVLEPILMNKNESWPWPSILALYRHVSPDQSVRAASNEAAKLLNDVQLDMDTRADFAGLLRVVYELERGELDEEQRRILDFHHKTLVLNGLGQMANDTRAFSTDSQRRGVVKQLHKELTDLTTTAMSNLVENQEGVWFSSEELEGVPFEELGFDRLEAGSGEEKGKDNINIPLFQKIVELRDELAKKVGFENHASLRISSNMAKTPANVNNFLAHLHERVGGRGAEEAARMLERKRRDCQARGVPFDGNLYLWDRAFYSGGGGDALDEDEMDSSRYFPLEGTLGRVLGQLVWHPDVRMYAVWDDEEAGGAFAGYLYLDLFWREHKAGPAFTLELIPGFGPPQGPRNYAATTIVTSFNKPASGATPLLQHSQLVALLHELGHALHDLTARSRYACGHGPHVAHEFLEVPSQMLENWAWEPAVIAELAEGMPAVVVERIVESRGGVGALDTLGQLHFSMFDMAIHSGKREDLGSLYNSLRRQVTGIKGPEEQGLGFNWGNAHASSIHLVGGYDANYYSYLWSRVYSADMFHSVFGPEPTSGAAGRRYRSSVLERAGRVDEMDMLEAFLGRRPSADAFYRLLG
ncbi:hypothetical protein CDD80_6167 [Ophiocordyceps camponoti-rufipedis]|uniref:Peptidase M3A/M3B catalytic domain-containing protein n=1 Tax=Ophiocordyceps camponoti-rufipedis TaxID=2004952 RepID=A0A2C5YRE1_9HYPO|nr:hypothetical protein CDD80_6167 [Ophiocordyceps camponoti-rufipedis]